MNPRSDRSSVADSEPVLRRTLPVRVLAWAAVLTVLPLACGPAGEEGTSTQASDTAATTIRINSGASSTTTPYVDAQGHVWEDDVDYDVGSVVTWTGTVKNTADPTLYLTEHLASRITYPSGFHYALTVPNGPYNVTLKFAENYSAISAPGERQFNVTINGTKVLSNFDVYAEAGGRGIAVDRTFPTTTTNGLITIQFSPGASNDPMVDAVEVESATGYEGCFTDTSTRDLPYMAASGQVSIESCKADCAKAGYAYAGLQYSAQCFCGNTYGRYGASTACTMPCSANTSEICGGTWANSVYSTGATCTGTCTADAGRADAADGGTDGSTDGGKGAIDSGQDANDASKDAGQVFAASCSQTDVQNAVNDASSGETVNVPGPCSVAWASAVDIPATKGITVKASGAVTITSTLGFTMEPNASAESRITGFSFTGSSSNPPDINIHVTTTASSSACRIDNNTFTNSGLNIFVQVDGQGPCLIDHNTFTSGPASEMIHTTGANAGSNAGWVNDVTPGGPQMVFIEDNTFTNSGTSTICSAIESYYGSRIVFRHNTLSFCQVDQHGTAGAVGARWWEVYDNDFYTPPGENQCCLITMRGGTGVIWGNTTSGSNTHTGAGIDLYEEDTGTWPLAYQVGSGINGVTNGHNSCSGGTLNSSPAYIWGNASSMSVGSQTPTIVVQGRDYFSSATQPASLLRQQLSTDSCSTTYNYVPYTYPHPLQSQ
jgi:hypothetical protein